MSAFFTQIANSRHRSRSTSSTFSDSSILSTNSTEPSESTRQSKRRKRYHPILVDGEKRKTIMNFLSSRNHESEVVLLKLLSSCIEFKSIDIKNSDDKRAKIAFGRKIINVFIIPNSTNESLNIPESTKQQLIQITESKSKSKNFFINSDCFDELIDIIVGLASESAFIQNAICDTGVQWDQKM